MLEQAGVKKSGIKCLYLCATLNFVMCNVGVQADSNMSLE